MAITFRDGVILGADSRTTTGAYIANRVTDKLTQVHDTIWCCRSGSAADTQAVADIVQYHLGMYGITNEEGPTTQTAAALFQELCYSNKDQLRYVASLMTGTKRRIPRAQAISRPKVMTEGKRADINGFLQRRHDYSRLRPTTWR